MHAALVDAHGCGCSNAGLKHCSCRSRKELDLWWGYSGGVVSAITSEMYAQCFQPCATFAIDSTPSRLHEQFAAAALQRLVHSAGLLGEMRLVAIFREPISRHLSWYNHRLPAAGWGVWLPNQQRYISMWEMPASPERWTLCEAKYGPLLNGSVPSHTMLARCEVERWRRARCSPSAPDGGLACWLGQARRNETSTWLVKGIYAPQLQQWSAQFPRRQLMVVSFDTLVRSGPRSALEFAGLPSAGAMALPHKNGRPTHCRVERVSCATRSALAEVYEPWNRLLYEGLRRDACSGDAPGAEPPFPPFEAPMCSETEPKPTGC